MLSRTQMISVASACIVATIIQAQTQTWVVDAAAAPGHHFVDIPPALQTAADGDTILVRSGSYEGGRITKGVTIIAATAATVSVRIPDSSIRSAAFTVQGLPAGKVVVLQGLQLATSQSAANGIGFASFSNCAGRIHVDRLNLDLLSPVGTAKAYRGFSIEDCAHVSIHATVARRGYPASLKRSTVLITDSHLEAPDARGIPGWTSGAPAGLSAEDCSLTLSRTTVLGGVGRFHLGFLEPEPGMELKNCRTTLTGTAAHRVAAGTPPTTLPPAPSAIDGSGGSLVLDPRVLLLPNGNAPSVAAAIPVRVRHVPSMSAQGIAPGGSLVFDLLAVAGDWAYVFVAAPFGPVSFPLLGGVDVWSDLKLSIGLGLYQVPASEHVVLTETLPSTPSLRGLAFTTQALTLSGGFFAISTPATFVLN